MATVDMHVDDIGTILRFTIKENNVPVDLTYFDEIILHLRKKDKTTVIRPLVYTTNGKDGKVEYVTQAGDIDQKGTFKGQVFLGSTSGSWHTSIVDFIVEDNIVED